MMSAVIQRKGRVCGLTFDMSGSRKPAKLAGGCPLDGGVRRRRRGDAASDSAWPHGPSVRYELRAEQAPDASAKDERLRATQPSRAPAEAPRARTRRTSSLRGLPRALNDARATAALASDHTALLHNSWGLTFDMSGGPKGAKRPLERPLDGGVRRRPAEEKRQHR